jgi:hypothetical protein
MSTSHLLLSYSTNVLRPLAENSNDKEALLAKVKRYEGMRILIMEQPPFYLLNNLLFIENRSCK